MDHSSTLKLVLFCDAILINHHYCYWSNNATYTVRTFSAVKVEAKLAILPHICNTNKCCEVWLKLKGPNAEQIEIQYKLSHRAVERYQWYPFQWYPFKFFLHELNTSSIHHQISAINIIMGTSIVKSKNMRRFFCEMWHKNGLWKC